MWVLSWRKYKYSKWATFISIVGAFTIYAGVTLVVSKEYVPGIITALVGVAIRFGAEKLARAKVKKLTAKRNIEVNESKKCLRCGKGLSPTDKFCNDCGYPC